MRHRALGRQGLEVSALGLGCMGMSQAYGPADDSESLRTLRRALDLGVTFWDTAQSYGAGHNERLVARALAGHRERVTLATKFGITRTSEGPRLDGRPETARSSCEASLRRLATDHIDLYYLHRVDPAVPVEETIGAMADLVVDGKVRYLGISECDPGQLARAQSVHPMSALQLEWSLWWREAEDDVIPEARRLGIGLVAYGPLGRGFLASPSPASELSQGDLRRGDARFSDESFETNVAAARRLGEVATACNATRAQLALAWLMHQGTDVVPIPGTKRVERLEENAAAAEIEFGPDDLARIDRVAPREAWAGSRVAFAAHRSERARPRRS